MADPAAALPWSSGDAQDGDTASEQELMAHSIQTYGLNIGDRIQVKWELQEEDGDQSEATWWGATVIEQQRKDQDVTTSSTTPSYILRYDARGEDFPEETHVARFLATHVLSSNDDLMVWRKEGDDYEPEEEEDGSDMEAEEGEAGQALPEYIDAHALMSSVLPVSATEQELMSLPGAAAHMAQFQDILKGFLDAKVQQKKAQLPEGEQVVVTGADMQEFLRIVRTMTQSRRGVST